MTRRATRWLAPAAVGVGVLLSWQGLVTAFDVLNQRLRKPLRILIERFRCGVPKAGQLESLVAPDCLDQLSPRAVSARGDLPNQRGGLKRDSAIGERSNNQQALTGPQIQSNLHRQIAVGFECAFEVIRHHRFGRFDFFVMIHDSA